MGVRTALRVRTKRAKCWLEPGQVQCSHGDYLALMSEKQQRLVLSIIEFLNQSIGDGTVKADDKEGLEVAGPFENLFVRKE